VYLSVLATALLATATPTDYVALEKSYDWAGMERAALAELQADPTNPDAVWYLSLSALAGDFEKKSDAAIDAAEACIEQKPSARCHQALGRLLGVKAQRGSMFTGMRLADDILENMQKAVALDPNSLTARDDLNGFYIAAPAIAGGGIDKAATNTAEFEKIDPVGGALLRADLLIGQDQADEGEAILLADTVYDSEALKDAHLGGLVGAAARRFNAKQLEQAKRLTDFAYSRYPDKAAANAMHGRELLESGDVDGAIAALNRSLEINPRSGAQFRLGQALEKKGLPAEAIAQYQAFLKLSGRAESPQGKEAKARLKALGG
jgi:tetratricopeptide (TPR) repeat protein